MFWRRVISPSLRRRIRRSRGGEPAILSPSANFLYDGFDKVYDRQGRCVLRDIRSASFSADEKWLVVQNGYSLHVYSVQTLVHESCSPLHTIERVGAFYSCFVDDSTFFYVSNEVLVRAEVSATALQTFDCSTACQGRPIVFGNQVYVNFILFTFSGKCLGHNKGTPLSSLYSLQDNTVFDASGEVCKLSHDFYPLIYSLGLEPRVLAEFIKLVVPRATWSDKGISLPTTDGKTFTFWWEPIATLLPAPDCLTLPFRMALLHTKLPYYVSNPSETSQFIDSLFSAYCQLTTLYDDLHGVTDTFSKSVTLAASAARNSTFTTALDAEVVSELFNSDRLAFRNIKANACKYVNSVLDLVLARSDKPSDPWCSEMAVNHALSQCGKPAAHAQRAALRFDVELREGLLVPRFRRLAEPPVALDNIDKLLHQLRGFLQRGAQA